MTIMRGSNAVIGRKRYTAPMGIVNHPGVRECVDGDGEGFDYKHSVVLKDGWEFKYGRMAGGRFGNFHTVADFLFAEPIKQND